MRRAKREQVYAAMARQSRRLQDSFTARDIADECSVVNVVAVRRVIYRMERDGMLEWVQRDPDNDRAMRWRLTPSGRARIERGTAG